MQCCRRLASQLAFFFPPTITPRMTMLGRRSSFMRTVALIVAFLYPCANCTSFAKKRKNRKPLSGSPTQVIIPPLWSDQFFIAVFTPVGGRETKALREGDFTARYYLMRGRQLSLFSRRLRDYVHSNMHDPVRTSMESARWMAARGDNSSPSTNFRSRHILHVNGRIKAARLAMWNVFSSAY